MPTATPFPTVPSPATVRSGDFAELLKLIPDTPETRSFVLINNYARAADLFDIQRPGADSGVTAFVEYILSLVAYPPDGTDQHGTDQPSLPVGPFISGFDFGPYGTTEEQWKFLGFDMRDVDQSIETRDPPGGLEVLRGRFDPDVLDNSIAACEECVPGERVEYRSTSYWSWGDGYQFMRQERLKPPAFDGFGRGGPLLVQQETVFRTLSTSGMESLIDTRLGYVESLADVEDFQAIARALDDLGAYTAFITDGTQQVDVIVSSLEASSLTDADKRAVRRQLEDPPLLRPYRALGVGAGLDDSGAYMTIVLVHDNPTLAAQNKDLLNRRLEDGKSALADEPWTVLYRIERVEIRVEGRVLLAKVYGNMNFYGDEKFNGAWLRGHSLLLAHE